jgi:glycosyltransferase involved in cell wall biosynthesis
MTPLTTVMMPARDAEATLHGAVESVLGQTVGDLELVVVDNCSRTPVADVLAGIRDTRLRILRSERNLGVSGGRNAALRVARSPLVSQLDADDLWEPDYLESIAPCFDDPAVGLAYCNALILEHPTGHSDYIGDPSVHPLDRFPKIAEQCPVPCPTATMRTGALHALGGYPGWLHMTEDYFTYMSLARAGWRFAYVHRQLARYRWPQAHRGMTYDKRLHARWHLALWASFVACHPLTPGPRRQLRRSVTAHVRRVLDLEP